jgi:hypothetical protein
MKQRSRNDKDYQEFFRMSLANARQTGILLRLTLSHFIDIMELQKVHQSSSRPLP